MNTPPTTAPTTAPPLDRFESALLVELRDHVATRSAPELTTPQRHPRRRVVAGAAVAAVAATAFVVASLGGPGASPAYAVEQTAGGEVVVTISRLEDSAGLERALRDKGIDADVDYDPTNGDGEPGPSGQGQGMMTDEHPQEGTEEGGFVTEGQPAESHGSEVDPGGCGAGGPATLRQERDDWVLRIPAQSPMQDRPVQITTRSQGDLVVFYAGNTPGAYCSVVTLN